MKSGTLVLLSANMTVPNSGPNGFLGDRIHQAPSFLSIHAGRESLLVWPDDAVTRTFFSRDGVEFVAGQTAREAVESLKGREPGEVFCFYSPAGTVPAGRETDCQMLREADAIVASLHGTKVVQPVGLDPLGETPVWLQLLRGCGLREGFRGPPWLLPRLESTAWAARLIAEAFPGRREGAPFMILSPFSGSPKKAVEESWWRKLVSLRADTPFIVLAFGSGELEQANRLFEGTPARVVEAGLDQTIALGAMPDSEVLGVDGGRLNLLAAARAKPVYAFFGIWPATAWGLPNVRPLPPGLPPDDALLPRT